MSKCKNESGKIKDICTFKNIFQKENTTFVLVTFLWLKGSSNKLATERITHNNSAMETILSIFSNFVEVKKRLLFNCYGKVKLVAYVFILGKKTVTNSFIG